MAILEKCNLQFNTELILADLKSLYQSFGYSLSAKFHVGRDKDKSSQVCVNLTYPDFNDPAVKKLVLDDRSLEYSKYFGYLATGYHPLKDAGIESASFTNTGDFFVNRYIGNVINQVKEYHSNTHPTEPPISRIFCAYINPGAGFVFHKDHQTVCKYHIPIKTNRWSFMYTDSGESVTSTHMPADGSLWRIDTQEMHTAMNLSPIPNDYRMHIIFNVFK